MTAPESVPPSRALDPRRRGLLALADRVADAIHGDGLGARPGNEWLALLDALLTFGSQVLADEDQDVTLRHEATGLILTRHHAAALLRALAELAVRRRDPVAALAEQAPALERWRREILEGQGRASVLERAAAWELTALHCEQQGDLDGAHAARAEAQRLILRRAA